MSTLPGQASKGEKTKQKFQSLDINSLYRVSRGENLEKTQQKSSLTYIKHGMQSLGKVPNARRAPANLPSLKAEHSGSDAAVPLVPAGSPGWGKQDQPPTGGSQQPQGSSAAAPPQQQQQQQSQTGQGGQQPQTQPQQNQLSSHQQAIALPVSTPIPPHPHKQMNNAGSAGASSGGGGDKLWSSVMGGHPEGGGSGHPPLYQSVQFQHEFPSLDGVPPARTPDGQNAYVGAAQPGGGGLSLRPQTEGSWTQGGQRGGSQHGVAGVGVGVGVENGPVVGGPRGAQGPLGLGGSGGPPQLPAQVGMRGGPGGVMGGAAPPPPVEQPFPPQIRGVMPPFMCKGSNFQQGPVGPTGMGSQQQQHMHMMQPPPSQQQQPRMNGGRHQPPRMAERGEQDDAPPLLSRPIIKEEELSRMDEIGRDMGWAESGEIDYNQKLAFSDDETDSSKPIGKRESLRRQHSLTPKDQQPPHHQQQQETSQNSGAAPSDRNNQWARSRGGRSSVAEEEELRAQQRRTQTEREVELAVQRAKQRKEEEEKRFQEERKQGAAKKLMELEEKIQKRASDSQEKSGSLPSAQVEHVDIPLPDFQKDKERDKDRDSRAKTPSDTGEDKNNQGGSFRHMAQNDGKGGFPRKHQKGGLDRERDQNAYARPFQYDLPPRFKNQRNNSSSNVQGNAPYHQWSGGQNASKGAPQGMPNRNSRLDSPEVDNKELYGDDRREYKRQSSEDSYRSSHSHHSQQDLQKIPESKRYPDEPQESEQAFKSQYSRKEEDKWHKDKDTKEDWGDRRSDKREEKYERERERPHRPDSRDSRSNRHSRDSDSRNEYNWADSVYEPAYEEKKKDDRRPAVPGPITKERIEAEDQRGSEKRTLTQLKKGVVAEKVEKADDAGSWADIIEQEEAKAATKKVSHDQHKGDHRSQQLDQAQKKSEDYPSSRNRSYSQKKNWNSGPTDYHPPRSQLWSKRSGSRHKGGKDYHPGTTDSDASAEEHVMIDQKNDAKNEALKSQRSPKPVKKLDKEDKNKENKHEKMAGEQKKQDKPEKKDNYIPRGEPSRHGRGGGAFRSGAGGGGRMGGLGKRIDGYGPPPSKSPFSSHPHDETKEKKAPKEETGTQQVSTVDHSTQQQHASSTAASTSTTTTTTTSSEDKIKQSQQALAAGIIGKKAAAEFVAKDDEKPVPAVTKSGSVGSSGRNDRGGSRQDIKRGGPKGIRGGRDGDAIPEGFDDRNRDKFQNKPQGARLSHSRSRNEGGRNNQPPRIGGNEKRSYDRNRQNSSTSLRKDDKISDHNVGLDAALKDSEHDEKEEKTSVNGDSEGFQEVKSKKNLKERQKSMDEKPSKNGQSKDIKEKDVGKDKERDRRNKGLSQLSSQQQQQLIQNIPPLMGTPVNPPAGMTPPTMSQQPPPPPPLKNQFDSRPRQAKLAPRFAKQKLQKAQMQQHHGSGGSVLCQSSVSDMAVDINKGLNVYGMKDSTTSQASVGGCAWDKPLGSQLRNLDHDNVIGVSIDNVKGLDAGQPSPQGTSPNSEKVQDKPLLDGATPPVNTIIFENTNFKQAPGARSSRNEKPRAGPVPSSAGNGGGKLEDTATAPTSSSVIDGASMMAGFNKAGAINDLLQNKDAKSDGGIQLPLFKEDSADMKLDFFGSDLQFSSSDDKGKTLCMTKSIHAIGSGNNTVDSLDIKIASVKKVWETSEQESEEMSFGGPPLDSNVFAQGKDTSDEAHHHHDAYTSSPNQSVSTSTNVCKFFLFVQVKPTQQVSGGSGTGGTGTSQTVLGVASGGHGQQHSGGGAMVAPGLMGNPLSPPPPMPQVLGAAAAAAAAAGVGLGPQQYTTNQHIGYQASLSGSTQYGIPAIPSPPTVPLVYGQTTQQQLQAAAAAAHQTAAAGLYGAFQIDQIGQGRSQFSQYPSYHAHGGLGQTASSPYTTQSVYLQAGPPHAPPPTAATAQAPPPDLYSNYRLSAAFGQGGQLSNPSTMLISSTTNSLMSVSSVKPAGGQTISAIGTKAGGVGQAFQPSPAQQSAAASQQSQQQQQQQQQQQVAYAMYDPSIAAAAANYLAAGGPAGAAMRGGPPSGNPSAAAVQNSVAAAAAAAAVQGLQPSSSFYSAGSTSQTGYFQQTGNSSMQSTQQLPQHQAGYGLQGNVFGSHGQSHTGTGLQSYNSHFLAAPMQVAAALNAQQFRSSLPAAAAAAYMKGVAGQQMGDQASRAQQLKSPGSQEVLSSVFNTGPQIPSPKSRQNCKQPPPQSSPTAQQKYNLYQGVGNQQNPNIQRYPTPIQRPVNYQQMQQNNSVNQKHRSNPSYKAPNRQYYGGQSK
nr:unnamed protein product [Callosobruchus chinensis]